jgi:hypothetical protein
MEIAALSQSLNSQALMGMLLVKVLDQTQEMIKQQAALISQQAMQVPVVTPDGVGENLDVVA